MTVDFIEIEHEVDELVEFFTSDTWEFFGVSVPSPEKIRENYHNGMYTGSGVKTFWLVVAGGNKAGLLRIYDLGDGSPLFDLRIHSRYRGLGLGTQSVRWLAEYIFKNYPKTERIEGTTRQDNYGMRKVLHKCGFVKEAQYRKAWRDSAGNRYDAIGYGILREDWEEGSVTLVVWDEHP